MRRPCTHATAHRGFTLIEVLVAMMVMALLATMTWQGVDGIVRARDDSQIRLNHSLTLNTVIAQWEQDMAHLQDTTDVPALSFDGISVRAVRRTESGLQLVLWSLRPGSDGQQQLLRWASPPVTASKDLQDTWVRSQQFVGSEPGQLQLLPQLTQWQVYFFRGNTWSNAQSSGDSAASVPAGDASLNAPPRREVLPTGVRMVLSFPPGSGHNGSLTRDVALGPQWP